MAHPWQISNIPGPKTANVLTPKVAAAMIKRSKNPILLAGTKISDKLGEKALLDYVLDLAKKREISIIASAETIKKFAERGAEVTSHMGLVEVVDRLRDTDWSANLKGPHDLAILVGIEYNFESQLLSTLKNFAQHLKTITIDKYYHPNASWSFQNMQGKEWKKALYETLQLL